MKGFKDYYPEEKRIQNYIFDKWKSIAEKYCFEEIDGPILEPVELYQKSGQEIPEQMYVLTDKSDRKLALRPELTPTVARMISQNPNIRKPLKWYSIGPFFRYEQPQFGRERQFFQFNMDILGARSMKADAEIITTAVKLMQSFGFTKKDFYIRISNRKLIQALLLELGIKQDSLKEIYRLIDKLCKISKKDFELTLKEKGLTQKQISSLLKLLEIKDLSKIKINNQGLDELKELFNYLKQYNILEFCRLDLSIMRGLDYYTSTVFEVFDSSRELRAIAGGGRYDELAKNCPGVGYAMGDVVLELFLKNKNKLPVLDRKIDFYIAAVNKNAEKESIKIAETLRKSYSVEIDLLERNLTKQLEYANSIKAEKVIILGPDEIKKKKLKIKDMKTGKEKLTTLKELIKGSNK